MMQTGAIIITLCRVPKRDEQLLAEPATVIDLEGARRTRRLKTRLPVRRVRRRRAYPDNGTAA